MHVFSLCFSGCAVRSSAEKKALASWCTPFPIHEYLTYIYMYKNLWQDLSSCVSVIQTQGFSFPTDTATTLIVHFICSPVTKRQPAGVNWKCKGNLPQSTKAADAVILMLSNLVSTADPIHILDRLKEGNLLDVHISIYKTDLFEEIRNTSSCIAISEF